MSFPQSQSETSWGLAHSRIRPGKQVPGKPPFAYVKWVGLVQPLPYSLASLFVCFLATLHGMWDLSSLTRDQSYNPALAAQSPNHWTAKEVPAWLI